MAQKLSAAAALARARAQVGNSITPQGMCLNFVWRMYGAVPSVGNAVGHLDTAWNAWSVVSDKVTGDRDVPAGFFAMLGPSPTRTDKNKNAGDIIISAGDGTFICTDASGSRVQYMTLAAREAQTQRPFVGWGKDLGGHSIVDDIGGTSKTSSSSSSSTAAASTSTAKAKTLMTYIVIDAKGNYWVCDPGSGTRYNLVARHSTVASAMSTLKFYRAAGVVVFLKNKQGPGAYSHLIDITKTLNDGKVA